MTRADNRAGMCFNRFWLRQTGRIEKVDFP